MRVLCKQSWWEPANINDVEISFVMGQLYFAKPSDNGVYVEDGYKKWRFFDYGDYNDIQISKNRSVFKDFFISEKELRKLKLKKLNEEIY